MRRRRRCHEHREGIIIMYPCDKQCACNDENDDQTTDLSLCDTKRLRDYLKAEERMINDLPMDDYTTEWRCEPLLRLRLPD
eukprot:16431619-Heterocapsa_arctica.AAC.1